MKKIVALCIGIFSSLAFSSHPFASMPHTESLDTIVAIVNDAPITQSEVDVAMDMIKRQMAAMNTPTPAKPILQKQVLQQIIDKKIQLQLAEQAGLTIKEEDVTKAIKHIAESNHATVDQLYDQVKLQGLSIDEYRNEIHDQMLIQQVQQHEVGSRIHITPQEVKEYLQAKPWEVSNNKEYHIEDIVIALPDTPTTQQIQEAKKKADDLYHQLEKGMSFNAAASDPASPTLQGSDLGWRKLPEIPSVFVEKVMRMKEHDISEPIQAPNGFHIIHLVEVRGTNDKDMSKHQVENLIFQHKMEEGIQTWLSKMRSQAFINLHPEK